MSNNRRPAPHEVHVQKMREDEDGTCWWAAYVELKEKKRGVVIACLQCANKGRKNAQLTDKRRAQRKGGWGSKYYQYSQDSFDMLLVIRGHRDGNPIAHKLQKFLQYQW